MKIRVKNSKNENFTDKTEKIIGGKDIMLTRSEQEHIIRERRKYGLPVNGVIGYGDDQRPEEVILEVPDMADEFVEELLERF